MAKIKIKAKSRKGVIKLKALVKHPMETGMRKQKGKTVPANHITDLVVSVNGVVAVDSQVGSSISKNPYFQFWIDGAKGDSISLTYTTNLGKTGTKTVKSK
jgi:sulfur-oxidizing protein SoxZ